MDLKKSVAIVTGSSAGLGAEIAKQLAAKGCRVTVNYSKSEKEAKAFIHSRHGASGGLHKSESAKHAAHGAR